MSNLAPSDRRIVEAVSAFAFVNPFSPERDETENQFVRVTGGDPSGSHAERFRAFFKWVDSLKDSHRDYRRFAGDDRERMRITFLFESYHRYNDLLDDLITQQTRKGDKPCAVPFGAECIGRLESHGFSREEAVRYFGIFYQLRRAHSFIVRGLKGSSPCMFQFRRRLWNSVFTNDVRWYERHLWNRMEDFSTLLLGETGSGKGAAAAAIGRSGFIPFLPEQKEFAESFNRSFISINLAEFPETLIEAELFGYRKGAFTGAVEAHEGVFALCSPHGAIFLDEIGEVSSAIQIKLLHVLQDRTFVPVGSREKRRFSGRVISATNRSLAELRGGKIFRDDFFYRISSDIIETPSLRERIREDERELDLLLETILEKMTGEKWKELYAMVRECLSKTPGRNYEWPGNVRELEQAVRRILVSGTYQPQSVTDTQRDDLGARMERLELTADELLSAYCQRAVQICGARAAAARKLGVDVRTLQKYLAKNPA